MDGNETHMRMTRHRPVACLAILFHLISSSFHSYQASIPTACRRLKGRRKKSLSEKMTGDKKGRDGENYPWLPGWTLPWERGKREHGESGRNGKSERSVTENAGELLKAFPCDKRKKCFRLLLIILNNWTTSLRFVSGHHNTAPDKWASLRAHIRFSQLHLLFMTFSQWQWLDLLQEITSIIHHHPFL